ncbi:MAG TPA: hypothetical protein VJB61_14445 [Actinomycetota bacterium]
MSADPRSRAQRRRDTENRLTHDIDDVEALEIDALPQERGDRFTARTGFDLMRDGRWLV